MYQSDLSVHCVQQLNSPCSFPSFVIVFSTKIRSNNCRDSLKKGLLILLQSLGMTLTKRSEFLLEKKKKQTKTLCTFSVEAKDYNCAM